MAFVSEAEHTASPAVADHVLFGVPCLNNKKRAPPPTNWDENWLKERSSNQVITSVRAHHDNESLLMSLHVLVL